MLQNLKLLVEFAVSLNILVKDERLSFFESSSEEDDELSLIINIAFQTSNQELESHSELIFLLTKEMKVLSKDFITLLENIIEIDDDVFLLVRIFTAVSKFLEILLDVHQSANIVLSILIHEIVSLFLND